VIGQAHVTDPLRQALSQDRTNHAYLFSGPRGCGKTTSARILARCLNCHTGPTDTPCGECPSCVELSRDGGGSLDVVEIDAASHNGVDDARELRERAVFAPSRDRYKIFILDEAHMVTQQGFNALLKIVEEPPEHIKFIFATTEPDKVLTTIRSRTHHYPFRLVPPAELISYLESVLDTEGLSVEEGVLALVTRAGGGSVRDSLSLLDQLMAGSTTDTLTLADSRQLLGYTPRQVLDDVIDSIANSNAPELFKQVENVVHSGGDPKRFVEDFLAHIRDLIVVQATGPTDASLFPGVPVHEVTDLFERANQFSPGGLSRMAELTSHTLGSMAGVTSPRLHLEVLMAKILSAPHQAATTGNPSESAPAAAKTAAAKPGVSTPAASAPAESAPASTPAAAPTPAVDNDSAPDVHVEPVEPWNREKIQELWPAVIASLAESKRSLWAALSDTVPLDINGDIVTIGFPRRNDAEILRKPQGPGSPLPNADLLRDAIYTHSGYRVRFTVADLPAATTPMTGSWPVVSALGGDQAPDAEPVDDLPAPFTPDTEGSDVVAEDTVADDTVAEATVSTDSPEAATGMVLGQRGEPAIRTILGGELIAEELLEPPASEAGDV